MTLPSRHTLSEALLKRVTNEIHLRVTHVTDGWSDTNSSSIINFMAVAPGMPSVFWSSWSTQTEQHTAAYLAGEIEKVISEIERKTTAQVIAVITDNAKTMRSASGRIEVRRPNVVSGG
ncbi:hypothetical protein L914_06381 [Phytophthora nicotianae]|uniref:DUF659 domain-containing protein n=1 Tax=Phytophthora nicotianae TaxID=4792 RepID=W2NMV3_PHYNI|nr:hypothetical protein L914_06381 [Phytophthora nicotianae]